MEDSIKDMMVASAIRFENLGLDKTTAWLFDFNPQWWTASAIQDVSERCTPMHCRLRLLVRNSRFYEIHALNLKNVKLNSDEAFLYNYGIWCLYTNYKQDVAKSDATYLLQKIKYNLEDRLPDERNPLSLWLLSKALCECGFKAMGMRFLTEALRKDPWNPEAWSLFVETIDQTLLFERLLSPNDGKMASQGSNAEDQDLIIRLNEAAAAEDFNEFSDILGFPKCILAQLAFAKLKYYRHEYACSSSNFQECLSQVPNSPYILTQLAKCAFSLKDYSKSEQLFEEADTILPCQLDGAVEKSDLYVILGKISELTDLSKKAFQIDKYSSSTACIIGNWFVMLGDKERAIIYFTRATFLSPQDPLPWILLGYEYLQMGNTKESTIAYNRALIIDHRDVRAHYGLANACQISENYLMAIMHLKDAIFYRSDEPRIWEALGDCQYNIADYKRAIISYFNSDCAKSSLEVLLKGWKCFRWIDEFRSRQVGDKKTERQNVQCYWAKRIVGQFLAEFYPEAQRDEKREQFLKVLEGTVEMKETTQLISHLHSAPEAIREALILLIKDTDTSQPSTHRQATKLYSLIGGVD